VQGITAVALNGSRSSDILWGEQRTVQCAVRDDELGASLRVGDVVTHAGRAEVRGGVVGLGSRELPQPEAGEMTVVNWDLGLVVRLGI